MAGNQSWEEVERIYHAALEREGDARTAFLEDACHGDTDLRNEVDSLLKFDGQAARFIETPAIELEAKAIAGDEMKAEADQLKAIGPFQLLSIIGNGGMGTVYLAIDTRLDRKVALKLLSAEFIADAERVSRFKQEARTTSTLDHPNIVTIFEIGELDGRHYIVAEYVEGETLREHLTRALEVRETLSIATQIVEALAAAHQAGIIHRDVKPENIVIRKAGVVKILDFGIAKLTALDSDRSIDQLRTQTGMIMGTASYMSPEQARGQQVDHRTDIFSVGAIIYEMLSGKRPFTGETASDVMAAVLVKDPQPLDSLAANVPPPLQRIVERCLEKSPEKRFQSAGDLAFALKQVSDSFARAAHPAEISSQTKSGEARSRFSLTRILLVSGIILAIVGVGYWRFAKAVRKDDQVAKPPRAAAPANPAGMSRLAWFDRSGKELGTVGETALYSGPAFSAGEDRVVVSKEDPDAQTRDLWILSLTSSESQRLTSESADDLNPIWTPDGKWIIYTSERNGFRNIYRKAADGTGAAESVLTAQGDLNVEDISPDGSLLIYNAREKRDDPPGLEVLSLVSGTRTSFAPPPARAARFSPDGRWVAYEGESGIFVRPVKPGNGQRGDVSGGRLLVRARPFYQVSPSGKSALTPAWRGDSKELFYLEGHTLMVAEITNDGVSFGAGSSRALFTANIEDSERRNRYLVTKDGQRFLMIVKTR